MNKQRLDQLLVNKGLVSSRSQAENYIKLGEVQVNGKTISKPGFFVSPDARLTLSIKQQYVSRAALKLASIAEQIGLNFEGRTILDVGSSTGGFTDFALRHAAVKVIAVDVGTDQLHPSLRDDGRIELHEKTDVRDLKINQVPDIVLIDVSFISLREVLPAVAKLCGPETQIAAMVKPQFEAGAHQINKGVIKNDTMRRQILKDFEAWAKNMFAVIAKADSEVTGAKGNRERFYLLRLA
jgi:23S rRNA (cytidine1920-2'-O)/16S rRNA (cytidine1409-2'-O)-methyltransferase